jgi:tetratricopeptide (TPR) repeat protein
MEGSILKQKVSEYFKRYGYLVELDEKVSGFSGTSHEVDVLAMDKNFIEVRIACQCKASLNPVDEDSIISWDKVCNDIHAIPAFASTSGYTDSALEAAKKFGFILLVYNEPIGTLYKIGGKTASPLTEEFDNLISQAELKLKKVDSLINQYDQYMELDEDEEAKKIESDIKALLHVVISLYKEALKLKSDKLLWLRLGDIYKSYERWLESFDGELEERCEEEALKCYMNALKEHLKEFPEILKKVGSIELSDDNRKIFIDECEQIFGLIPSGKQTLSRPELVARVEQEKVQIAKFQIKMLETYLDINPNDADAWLKLAENYVILLQNYPLRDDYVEEIELACEKALKLAPNDRRIAFQVRHIYERILKFTSREKGRYIFNKLIELLKKLCELEPKTLLPRMELAELYGNYKITDNREKDLEEAIRYMEECIKISGGGWSLWKKLGDLYFKKCDKEKMIECYSKALEEYIESIEFRKKFRNHKAKVQKP